MYQNTFLPAYIILDYVFLKTFSYLFRIHVIVTPVSIVQLAFMDLQARDTFTSVRLVTREKIAKKANNKCLLCDVQTNVYYPRGHK